MARTIHVIEHWRIAEPDYGRRHLAERGFDVRVVEPWRGEALPELSGDEAGVMLMGGPQYVTELEDAPYLKKEMRFAERAMTLGVPVVGVCLGSQMLAHMLGARVGFHPEDHATFGYYDLYPTGAGRSYFPERMKVLAGNSQGWEMPKGATPLAYGEVFENQAFLYDGKTIALQFHPEVTRPILDQWQDEFASMIGQAGTQTIEEQDTGFVAHDAAIKRWYAGFLDDWFGEPDWIRRAARLAELAGEHNVLPEAVALAWIMAHPASIMPVVGTNNPERIARIADSLKVGFDRETWYELWTLAEGKEIP